MKETLKKTGLLIQMWAKYTIFFVFMLLLLLIRAPNQLRNRGTDRNDLTMARWTPPLAKFFLGLDIQLEGSENVVHNTGSVVLINHQSVLDVMVLSQLWTVMDRLVFVTRKLVICIVPLVYLYGIVPIDRNNLKKAKQTLEQTATLLKDKKVRMVIYPEGTRNRSSQLKPFKKGAFHLAISTGCPIQPVVVSPYEFLGKHYFKSGRVIISILPAIKTAGLKKENIDELIAQTHRTMSDHYAYLNERNRTKEN